MLREIFFKRALEFAMQWLEDNKEMIADKAIEYAQKLLAQILAKADGKELMMAADEPEVICGAFAKVEEIYADTAAEYGSAE